MLEPNFKKADGLGMTFFQNWYFNTKNVIALRNNMGNMYTVRYGTKSYIPQPRARSESCESVSPTMLQKPMAMFLPVPVFGVKCSI